MGAMALKIEVVPAPSPPHAGDIGELRARGVPIPHQYTSWPVHDSQHRWRWCRVLDTTGRLVTGFAVELSSSRAVPGTCVGRIERLGRQLHEPVIPQLATLLPAVARAIPRLQRLDVQIFDEQQDRRGRIEASILAAGGEPLVATHGYAWTVILPLRDSDEALLASLTPRTRHRIRGFSNPDIGCTSPVTDAAYLPRLRELFEQSFHRTNTQPPAVRFEDILADSRSSEESILVGAFVRRRCRPDDLVAFGWGRLHGDHVVYETAGSERSDDLRGLSTGDAVIWHLARWARTRNASWLDLGGVAGPGEPGAERLQGISAFKRRVAGPDIHVASEFRLVARPRLDAVARAARTSAGWLGLGERADRKPVRQDPAMARKTGATSSAPVLVLGAGLTALGVLRICHRSGIPAYSMGGSTGIDRRSRWYREAPADAAPGGEPVTLESFLRRCRLPTAVLMPCSDAMVMQASRLEGELAARFPASISAPATMATLVDKAAFAKALQAAGVPHPTTVLVSRPEDLASLPDSTLQGAFLKPHDSQTFFARFSVKAFRVASREEGIARMRDIEAAGQRVLLQEYIPGPGSLHYLLDGFVDRGGTLRGLLTRRRLRMHPRDFGNSSFMVSVPRDEVAQAVDSVTTLLRHIGFRGIFSAEFKHDPRDGLFKILEVNARPWWYIEYTERCGLDVCSMAYRDALGLPVETVPGFKVGKRLVYPYYDFFACRDAWREGEMTLTAWARSWIGAQQPLFNWSDPMPALYEAWTTAGHRTLRRLRLMSRTQP